MELKEYQERAMTTCMESSKNDIYAINGLTAEAGEVHDKVAKWVRKGFISVESNCIIFTPKGINSGVDFIGELSKEVGDVLWFVALLSERLGIGLEDIAQQNLAKLAARKVAGTIDGNGDGISGKERTR